MCAYTLTGAGGRAGPVTVTDVAGRAVAAVARGLGPGGDEHATAAPVISTSTSAAPDFPVDSHATGHRKSLTRPAL
jgi:hypothetical protein